MSILRTSNNTWTYDFWHLGKRYRQRFKSRTDAIQSEALKRIELGSGPVPVEKLVFREAAALFFEKHSRPNKLSWKSDACMIKQLNQLFGNKKLAEFTSLDVQGMRNHLQESGLSSASVDRFHSLVKTIFNKMIYWQRFNGQNPANRVRLKRAPNAHVRFLSREELQRLESNLSRDVIYPYYVLALHTGMRRSEIRQMKWEHITFPLKDIYVPNSKSGKSRHIPMNDTAYDLVKRLYGTGQKPEDFVLAHLGPDYVSHRFRKICRKLKITDFRFHDLRHTFASYLVMADVNIFQVSKWLGHSSVTITEKHYAHLSPSFKREEIQKLNKLSFGSQDGIQTNFGQTFEETRNGSDSKVIDNTATLV